MEDGMHVDKFGHKRWYLNGLRHREDGPAVIWAGGSKAWFKNDELHREDGPAREWADGDKEWYLDGECHREDGPAIIFANGSKEWCLNGKRYYSFDDWLEALDVSDVSDDDKLILKLKWA